MDKSRTKFNVTKDTEKRTYKNEVFDSITEMRFFRDWIEPKMESGEVISCDRQITFELQKKFVYNGKIILPINYVADFVIKYKNNKEVVIDIKGMPDSVAILKSKLFKYKYPDIDYQWICYSLIDSENGNPWVSYEKVKQGRNQRRKNKKKGAIN